MEMGLIVLEPLTALLTVLSALILGPIVYGVVQIGKTLQRWHQIDRETERLPDLPGRHWLWGTITDDFDSMVIDMAKRHKVAKEFTGPMPVVNLLHPETAKVFLATSYKNSRDRENIVNKCLRLWLGNGLLLSEGDKWRHNRKLLTPAFHFKVLQSYVKVYNNAVGIFLQKVNERIQSDVSVEICQLIHFLTLDVILKCAFNFDDDVQITGGDHPYVKAIDSLQELTYRRLRTPHHFNDTLYSLTSNYRQFRRSVDTAHQMSDEIISKRRLSLEKDASLLSRRRLDFLDILLAATDDGGQGMTDEEIRNEINTFLFAGYETTASAIPCILYSLAKHPDHQSRCQQEIDQLFVNRDVDTVLWEDLSQMSYLTRCIKEGMRLYPPIPRVLRELREPLVVEGVTVPAGTMINCNIHAIHHNVTVWGQNIHEFEPDRFLPDNLVGMDSHAFLAFSAGPRNCIGQNFALNEMKTVLSRVLRRFWVEVDESHEVKFEQFITQMPVNGIKLKFLPRR